MGLFRNKSPWALRHGTMLCDISAAAFASPKTRQRAPWSFETRFDLRRSFRFWRLAADKKTYLGIR